MARVEATMTDKPSEPIQDRLQSAQIVLRESLSRLSDVTDNLCGSVPQEAESVGGERTRMAVFDAVDYSAMCMETTAREIHQLCDRIGRRTGC